MISGAATPSVFFNANRISYRVKGTDRHFATAYTALMQSIARQKRAL